SPPDVQQMVGRIVPGVVPDQADIPLGIDAQAWHGLAADDLVGAGTGGAVPSVVVVEDGGGIRADLEGTRPVQSVVGRAGKDDVGRVDWVALLVGDQDYLGGVHRAGPARVSSYLAEREGAETVGRQTRLVIVGDPPVAEGEPQGVVVIRGEKTGA